jgi:solute carrier family 25 S-adenosylmethionine transporter 26
MTAALAWLLPPAPGAAAAAAARRHNNAALRERALVGAIAGAMAGAFVNGLLVRASPGRAARFLGPPRSFRVLSRAVPGRAQHPLDTIKVQLQLRGSTLRGPRAGVAASFAAHGRAGGLARLYAGAPLAVIGSGASSALYFGAYDAAKAAGVPPPIAALMGNALSSLILVPKEVLKSRLQAGAPGGAMGVAAAALRSGGVRSLYAGYVPTLMRNAPSNVISFSTYEGLKALAQRQLARHSGTCAEAGAPLPPLPAPLAACAGACSGALAAVLTHPLDLVKTRLQTQGVGGRPPAGLALYAGVGPTLRAVVATEGPRGLSRGLTTRLAYNALFSSLGFAAFETAKRAIAAARPPPPPLEEHERRSSA